MRLELRHRPALAGEGAGPKVRGLVCVAETAAESKMLDQVFGASLLDGDGLIGERLGVRWTECRLSDGYAEHYVYIQAQAPDPQLARAAKLEHALARLVEVADVLGSAAEPRLPGKATFRAAVDSARKLLL